MMEPWNIKPDDAREADTLPTFIIFCEDKVSEPIYFKFFETSLIKVNIIGEQKSKIDNVLKAIQHCVDCGVMLIEAGVPTLSAVDTQVWCVFDRDAEDNAELRRKSSTYFDESIETARARGIRLAWSNDAFELWILLHFMDVNHLDESYKNRIAYYDSLTAIFKAISDPNEDLAKALAYQGFNYKESLKSQTNFRNIVRSEIVGKTNMAIERAKFLEEYHFTQATRNSEKAPCTLVHHLVLELIKLGGKEY